MESIYTMRKPRSTTLHHVKHDRTRKNYPRCRLCSRNLVSLNSRKKNICGPCSAILPTSNKHEHIFESVRNCCFIQNSCLHCSNCGILMENYYAKRV